MKYGERISTHSVPEWRSHNIMYDALKREIKDLTSSHSSFSECGYNQLVTTFEEEIGSVRLFVKCKIGEIEYRFQQCGQLMRDLSDEPDSTCDDRQKWQLDKEIGKATQEFQNILRFVSAQAIGLKKLMKKYIKHAPKEQLQQGRDLQSVASLLSARDSFLYADLTPQFMEFSILHSTLRSGQYYKYLNPSRTGRPSVSLANEFVKNDAHAMSGLNSNVWRFWVHEDNLMQLKVFLVQHMDLLSLEYSGMSSSSNTSSSSHVPESTKTAYLDTKDLQSACKLEELAQIRQVQLSNTKSSPFLLAPIEGLRRIIAIELSNEQLEKFPNRLEIEQEFNIQYSQSPEVQTNGSHETDSNQEIRNTSNGTEETPLIMDPTLKWITSLETEIAVSLETKSTRFRNNDDYVWATLDVNAVATSNKTNSTEKFPYAVLEIRSRNDLEWVSTLRNSHLVYQVQPSFSLFSWSLLATRSQQILFRPSWLDLLETSVDIRRDPSTIGQVKFKRHFQSADGGDTSKPTSIRYWNEFDNGEDFENNQEFFDGADNELQRTRVATKLAQPVYKIGEGMRRQFNTWFESAASTRSSSSGLSLSINSDDIQSINSVEPPSSGQYSPRILSRRGSVADRRSSNVQNYGSCDEQGPIQTENLSMQRRNDQGLTLITFLCFCLSAGIVTLVFAIIITEDLSLLPSSVRAALILFLTIALCLALLGYITFHFRSQVSWTYQILVNINLLTIVCFGMGGIANISLPPLS